MFSRISRLRSLGFLSVSLERSGRRPCLRTLRSEPRKTQTLKVEALNFAGKAQDSGFQTCRRAGSMGVLGSLGFNPRPSRYAAGNPPFHGKRPPGPRPSFRGSMCHVPSMTRSTQTPSSMDHENIHSDTIPEAEHPFRSHPSTIASTSRPLTGRKFFTPLMVLHKCNLTKQQVKTMQKQDLDAFCCQSQQMDVPDVGPR